MVTCSQLLLRVPKHKIRAELVLRVPKHKIRAELVLAGAQRSSVVLYVAPGQDVGELLAGEERFVPIRFSTGTRLVARTAIVSISVPLVVNDDLPAEQQQVIVHLRGGSQMSGELRWVAPPGRRRTLDHLNDGSNFLILYDGDYMTFVAKDHVVSVEEI
jgi:hypothetical protein